MNSSIRIVNFNEVDLKPGYGILSTSAFRTPKDARTSTEFTFCQIPPSGQTQPHAHYETEFFQIKEGSGLIFIDGHQECVQEGDLIQIPSFSTHYLVNTNAQATLDFISVFSEATSVEALPTHALVTSAPPTPNGPLHLGHLSGPYLAADIVTRYLKMRRVSAIHKTGTDDFQNYVQEKGLRLNMTAEQTAEAYRKSILEGLGKSQIKIDEFIHPLKDEAYQEQVQNFFETLRANGSIVKKKLPLPHCSDCNLTLIDVHLKGTCPYCSSASSGACESCGIVSPAYEVLDPHCSRCGQSASPREEEVFVFELAEKLESLREFHQSLANNNKKLGSLLKRFHASHFSPMIVSHPGNWGIALKGERDQVIHVWFEMAASYSMMRKDQQGQWIHSFGMDNAFYYLFLVSGLMRAFDPNLELFDAVIVNDFLKLEGKKFSTSQGHAIWVNEFLEQEESDLVRLFLTKVRPELHSSNYSVVAFDRFKQDEYFYVQKMLEGQLQRKNLSLEPSSLSQSQRNFLHRLNLLTREFEEAYHPQTFSPTRAYQLLGQVRFELERLCPLENPEDEVLAAIGKRIFAKVAYPLMPNLSSNFLEETDPRWEKDVGLYV